MPEDETQELQEMIDEYFKQVREFIFDKSIDPKISSRVIHFLIDLHNLEGFVSAVAAGYPATKFRLGSDIREKLMKLPKINNKQ